MRRVEMKKQYILGALIFVIALVTVGFALLQSSLSINGTVSTKSNSWNIYFDSIVLNQDSVSKTLPTISNRTSLSFSVELDKPGDIYEFTVDAVNDGSIDAMINNITATNLTVEQLKLVDFSYTYNDDTSIEVKDYLKSNTREKIKVYIKYRDDITSADLTNSNISLPISIAIEYVQADETAKEREVVQKGINLYNMMKENAQNVAIDFSQHSGLSGTNGIYTTTETEGNVPVYYYRGAANQVNNNVIFNNMCWKIIRTTETGGVKLIYNGIPNASGECVATGTDTQIGTSAFNESYNDNAYVGYMYGTPGSSTYAATHANTNESTIKKESIDPWFEANFDAETVAKLEDTVFCDDRSTVAGGNNNLTITSIGTLGYGKNATGYGALARAAYSTQVLNPSLVCANVNDKFTVSESYGNGALSNPVGLITLDELVLAGYNTFDSNNSDFKNTTNYLHTEQDYWTLSPVFVDSAGYACVGNVFSVGVVNSRSVDNTFGVRPVVSLADGTLVEPGGTGTLENPYVVK